MNMMVDERFFSSVINNSYKHPIERVKKMKDEKAKPRQLGQRGFTIVEVMITIVIFSIGILGAMSMQTRAVTTNAASRKSTLAIEYASDTMELLMHINASLDDKYLVDDDGDGTVDEADEEDDGIDNDNDGTVDNEVVWHQLPEFAVGTGYSRGAAYLPENAYYDSIFNLTWNITDIDCDVVAPPAFDAKRIDITVTWDNGNRTMQLSNLRTSIL